MKLDKLKALIVTSGLAVVAVADNTMAWCNGCESGCSAGCVDGCDSGCSYGCSVCTFEYLCY